MKLKSYRTQILFLHVKVSKTHFKTSGNPK